MKPVEIVIIIVAAAIVVGVAVRAIIRKKKGKTGCDCGCSDCPGCCPSAKKQGK